MRNQSKSSKVIKTKGFAYIGILPFTQTSPSTNLLSHLPYRVSILWVQYCTVLLAIMWSSVRLLACSNGKERIYQENHVEANCVSVFIMRPAVRIICVESATCGREDDANTTYHTKGHTTSLSSTGSVIMDWLLILSRLCFACPSNGWVLFQ